MPEDRPVNTRLRYLAMKTADAVALKGGGTDDNANLPEKLVSDGSGYPCRHCLRDIAKGRPMLLLAWNPFENRHAYSETGPVFLCEHACVRHNESSGLPQVVKVRPRFMLRGYGPDERIVDGSGAMVETSDIEPFAHKLLHNPAIASVYIRSGTNTCFICRVVKVG